MSRMSARFVAQKVGMSTQRVYDMWKEMGLRQLLSIIVHRNH